MYVFVILARAQMLLHAFEPYTPVTFLLMICSERGLGKSMRAERFAALCPPGWYSFNSANTNRSGMNGTLALHTHTLKIRDLLALMKVVSCDA